MDRLAKLTSTLCARVVLVSVVMLGISSGAQADETLRNTAGLKAQELHSIMLAATSSKTTTSKPKPKSQKPRADDFDHLLTGFSLFGSHLRVECESCHIRGIFRGTPTTCEGCHGHPGSIASTFKPLNHVRTTLPCDFCHNSVVWAGARFDHVTVLPGSCVQCHNGSIADAKPTTGHPVTNESCESCHSVGGSWFPAKFRHIGVAPGTCNTCHGVTATGKPSGHQVTSESCDACHSTTAWLPATDFDHTSVVTGTCLNCHGTTSTGKPSGHIPATMSCDACHNTNTFTNSTMRNHSTTQGVIPGGCLLCHNGAYRSQGARGLPSEHSPSTVTTCDGSGCHTTSTWDR
jgi:hypothetical protein